ncbi:MAG: hypothetical protein M9916_01375 [Crocinitomicaceae bacterium]|nr:hypothetical protein [Crocinitomicaceae bacterium]
MKRIYFLKTCSTNQRIVKELNTVGFELINIKEQNIDASTLDWLAKKVGSYEALFSKKSVKYKTLGLNEKQLSEQDFRKWILDEYTFLKRPFILNNDEVFIGNSKETVEAAKLSLNK